MATVSVRERGIDRIALYAITSLTVQFVILTIWGGRYFVLHDRNAPMLGWDFVVFWSAARVALEHGATMVFLPKLMHAMEAAVSHSDGVAPWPYPPTFLLAVIPLGLLSFGTAFALFSSLGIAVYAFALTRIARGLDPLHLLFAAAFSGVGVALAAGQNSLFTVAAAGGALILLRSNPMLAGACIASLAIKPQFAVLFPVALVFGRQWKALVWSAAYAFAFSAVTTAVLGEEAWTAFDAYLPQLNQRFVEHGVQQWTGMPTVFAATRLAGLPIAVGYAAQALCAVPAIASTAYLWLRDARFELRAAALIISSLLVQPYFMHYDLAWLALPILFLMRDSKVCTLNRLEWTVVGAAWLMPAQGFLAVGFNFPCQIATVVLNALLAVVMHRHFAAGAEIGSNCPAGNDPGER